MNTNGLDYRTGAGAKTAYPAQGSGAIGERILLLDGAINLITEAADKASSLKLIVSGIADSIYGPLPPTPETANGATLGYNGRAHGLDNAITGLHTQLKELEAQIERIRGL